MRYFPLFHDTQGLSVVVIGGGEVAARKLALWARSEAELTVISPRVVPAIEAQIRAGRVRHLAQFYQPGQLDGHQGVIAATDDPALNRLLSAHGRELGLWVNVVDDPDACSVITPALVDRQPVVVAIGSEGAAPVLVSRIRSLLEGLLPQGMGRLASFMAAQRPRVQAQHPSPRRVWQRFIQRNGLDWQDDSRAILAEVEDDSTGETPAGKLWLLHDGQPVDGLPIAAMAPLQALGKVFHARALDPVLDDLCRRDAERQPLTLNAVGEVQAALARGQDCLLWVREREYRHWQEALGETPFGQFNSGAVRAPEA